MQAFEYRKDDKIIGLIHDPKTGDIIDDDNLKSLGTIIKNTFINYISEYNNLTEEEKNLINSMTISDNSFNFSSTNDQQLCNIVIFFQKIYGEKIVVPQNMGTGPAIRHRPLYFEVNNNSIIVKYTTFGDFNNFTTALKVLGN